MQVLNVFFDTYAFVKRYINESGTDIVLEWCDKATENADLCDLTPAVLVLAQSIMSLENNVRRGIDAIHVGSAVVLKADVFCIF